MEKFGLFNLLSALSSLTASAVEGETAEKRGAAPERAKEPAKESGGIFTAEQRAARCTQILERHERISQSIDRKNKP